MQLESFFLSGRCTNALENFLSDIFFSALFAILNLFLKLMIFFFILPNFEFQKWIIVKC